MRVVLDSSVLSDLLNPKAKAASTRQIQAWGLRLLERGEEFWIPGICDYEVRRKLCHLKSGKSLGRLNEARRDWEFLPVSQEHLDAAAEMWADLRLAGKVTAADAALDGDVILCAQARDLAGRPGDPVVVATTNVKHLIHLVDARLPAAIP